MSSYGLTPAEQRVAKLLVHGWSNKRIALELGIKEHTVKEHLRIAYDKVGAESRVHLVVILLGIAEGDDQ